MLQQFIQKKLKSAKYKLLGDGSYFGYIPSTRGVWANNRNLEECRDQLREVLEEWLVLKIRDRESVPGFSLRTKRRAFASHA